MPNKRYCNATAPVFFLAPSWFADIIDMAGFAQGIGHVTMIRTVPISVRLNLPKIYARLGIETTSLSASGMQHQE